MRTLPITALSPGARVFEQDFTAAEHLLAKRSAASLHRSCSDQGLRFVEPRHASCGDKRFLAGEMDLEIDHRGRGSGPLSRLGDGHIDVNNRCLRDVLGLGPVQRWSQPAENAPAAAIFNILAILPHALAPEDLVHGCEHIIRHHRL